MAKKWLKSLTAFALVASLVSIPAPAATKAAASDFSLTIMHTNDTHANLDNIAKRVTLVNKIREANPNNLLLDAGDVFSGTLYFNEFKGQADLEFMNYMKYDAMTFGNHEFDLGSENGGHVALKNFVEKAKFPMISANVDFAADPNLGKLQKKVYTAEYANGEIYNGIIKEVDGEKIGIFGLTTEETPTISSTLDVKFNNYIQSAKSAVAAFEKEGINKIIAVTHLGFDDSLAFDNDQELAAKVDGIDVIVGGHTHSKLEKPVEVTKGDGSKTVIVQANEYNKFLGQLDVKFDEKGKITTYTGKLHDVGAAAADVKAAEMLKPYADRIATLKNTSITVSSAIELDGKRLASYTDGAVGGVRASETNLGNFITDGMLYKAKQIDKDTVIAMQNGGGIRTGINAGDITMGEVLTVMPFGNALAIMNLTGSEIVAALEKSVSQYPQENGGFLHVSGLSFTFDASKDAGKRVVEVKVGTGDKATPIDVNAKYKVASNTFTAKGGDGYDMFGTAYKEGRVSEPGFVDYEMFIEYAKSFGKTINPKEEGRIVPVEYVDSTLSTDKLTLKTNETKTFSTKETFKSINQKKQEGFKSQEYVIDTTKQAKVTCKDCKTVTVENNGAITVKGVAVGSEVITVVVNGKELKLPVSVYGFKEDPAGSGKWYFYDEKMNKVTNWLKEENKWYFFNKDGLMQTNWVKDGNYWYYLDSKGIMQTGWVKDGQTWYYLAANGAMKTNWVFVDGKWYFLNGTTGAMQTGWVKDGSTWYYLAANGAMKTGWVKDGSTWYYLAANGAMKTGWVKDGSTWYYLAANGAMKTGWIKDGNTWYYLASSGAMQTGWVYVSNKWYYLTNSGAMVTGTHKIGGKTYKFDASGAWIK